MHRNQPYLRPRSAELRMCDDYWQSLNPQDWSVSDVKAWLIKNNFEQYIDLLCSKHQIDGMALLDLNTKSLIKEPICMKIYGHARKISQLISDLRNSIQHKIELKITNNVCMSDANTSDEELNRIVESGRDVHSSRYEAKRCILSFLYLFFSCYITTLTMVIVHNRVPSTLTYPPLPDFLLENLPFMPWAFKASEVLLLINFCIWIIIVIFHQYRFILVKRYCSIFGTVFLLRCLTMLSTSLSVPGKHIECDLQITDGFHAIIERSFQIMITAGMSLNGMKTCGDYMFSGHTVCHILLTLFVIEYTSKRLTLLHFLSRMIAVLGMILILAAHEHYTLDVICALYVSLKTFSSYHVLTTARRVDRYMTKSWNPIFYYMEKPIGTAKVENVFESPLTAIRRWQKVVKSRYD